MFSEKNFLFDECKSMSQMPNLMQGSSLGGQRRKKQGQFQRERKKGGKYFYTGQIFEAKILRAHIGLIQIQKKKENLHNKINFES